MASIYRSYEVLVEETAGNHKSRQNGKTRKELKPHCDNTRRALKVTHELFQDAVCYYIFCLAGLVKDARDQNCEPINRMWQYLHCESILPATNRIAAHLGQKYFKQSDLGANPSEKLLEFIYASTPTKKLAQDTAALNSLYQKLASEAVQIKKQGKGKNAKTKAALTDMAHFASNWYQRLSNPASTQGGEEIISRNNAYWLNIAAELQPVVEPQLRSDFDDAAFAVRLKLEYCFNSPVTKLSREEALKDYGLAFGVVESGNSKSFWNTPLKTAVAALKRYASPLDPSVPSVTFDNEVTKLRQYAQDKELFSQFDYPGVASGSKPSGTYWLCLRYKFSPSPQTRRQLFENIKKRKATDSTNPLATIRSEFGYVFHFFTNLLGLSPKLGEGAVWTGFDKSAFKRAAEEVFKYRLRSDERAEQVRKRRAKIAALNGRGEWIDEKGKTKQLGGIEGDTERPRLMRQLLDRLGGAIGYGMRRATIGGWADLRQDFVKIAKKGEPIDEDELLAAIEKAREESSGGFGSGAFFKALCDEDYHLLWLTKWNNTQAHHPKNFVRWWVVYSEASEELTKVWDDQKDAPKPIAFTWPSSENRHGDTSFRPLDFEIPVTPAPPIDLFDCEEGDGKPIKLVMTNAEPPKKKTKKDSAKPPPFMDGNGNALYPLTLSYRRFKRDRIAKADGSSVEAEYAPPLVVLNPPSFHEAGNKKPLLSSASLLLGDKHGCWHFMFSFALEQKMQKALVDETATIPGEKVGSVRKIKKNGKWIGLYLRWPIDAKTEKKKDAAAPVEAEEIEAPDAKFSSTKLWCSGAFEPFDILSVDLGVRYAGAWCRAHIKVGHDADRPNQRTISPAGSAPEIVFDAYDFGTFRLQGEDAKIWRKDKYTGFGIELEQEKCGSRGRIASDTEKTEFAKLAAQVFPATARLPVPDDPAELMFFPDLGDHLVFRLRRRLGRIRFLFKLRWQVSGQKKKIGHEYKTLDGTELKEFRGEQRFNVLKSLAFLPKEDMPKDEEGEDNFMRGLRLTLAPDDIWSTLSYEHAGKPYSLFSKVKGGHTPSEKENAKMQKVAQKAAWAVLKRELESDGNSKWNWNALARQVATELQSAMRLFSGEQSVIAEVARFVWPLQDKKWKWTSCTIDKDGKIAQSFIERDELSREPKRSIHGMRGLNMKRIRLMQDFRQCCQSLAKLERRFYTEEQHGLEPSPVLPGDRIHEYARPFLDKINDLRDQRVNQTAHMILAEALGLQLMKPTEVTIDGKSKWELKSERDLHGRYEKKKSRVAAIVLEDLSRYRTSQDRSRYENSQLMEWSHRAVIGKLQDMAQVFGVQIITVDARFSSRFCSRTGVPGIRCAQVSKGFENEYPWKKWKEETIGKLDEDGKRKATERAEMILLTSKALNLADNPKATLVLPMDGGPAFLPVITRNPNKDGVQENADIGAAVNIGLRAVAHPDRLDIFPVLRTEAKADGRLEIKNRRGSLGETVVQLVGPSEKKPKAEEQEATSAEDNSGGDEELESGKFPYLYAAVPAGNKLSLLIADGKRYQLPLTADGKQTAADDRDVVGAAQGKDFWTRVKQDCWTRIKQINARRLKNLGIEPPDEWKI